MKKISAALIPLLLWTASVGAQLAVQPAIAASAPSAISGHYRNVFREWRPELTEQAVNARLDEYWRSLFEGDEDSRVYYPAPATANGPSAYILDVGNQDVRSEGMSYGMMIAVQMNKKAAFDALWNWAATHMRYENGPRRGYFRWQCKTTGCGQDAVPASDGEEYMATALLMAASRWGDGTGIYNYSGQANAILDVMLHKEDMNGGVVEGARAMFSPKHQQVVFVPVADAADFSDPSYHLPAFYELWARRAAGWQGGQERDRKQWARIAETSRRYFEISSHPKTALTPDYAEFDGRPRHLEGHGDFRYDAFRTAANWSVDQAWWGKNPGASALSGRLLDFFSRQDQLPYPSLYSVDGTVLDHEGSPGLISCNAVATLALDGPVPGRFIADLWELKPPKGKWRYYNGLLQFLGMLHVSGNFKAY
jgi:endo-1,4-beta-D-glucanase Y